MLRACTWGGPQMGEESPKAQTNLVDQPAWASITKDHRPEGLNNAHLLLLFPEAGKSKSKA